LFAHDFVSDDIAWRSNQFQHEDYIVYEDRKARNYDLP